MAEATVFRNNALPYPIYAEQFTVTFPMLDADGDLVTGATTPDAEVSKNGDTFADCTNESTEIATNSGVYYLNLTATEMTADIVTVIAKSATAGMKTTVITLYPRKLVKVRTGTCADDGSGTADVILDSGSSAVDDYYNGMIVAVVIDGAASAECRVITDYTGSTKAATVAVGFNTAVDNTDTFIIYLPEGALHGDSLYGDKIYSDTTTIQSDTTSLASDLAEGDFSDILSRLTVTNSQMLIVKSDTSDIRSNLAGLVAAAGILSDINSGIDVIQTTVSDIQSDTNVMVPIISDIQSDTNKLVSDATEVDTSDILSMLTVVRDNVSDIQSDTNVLITKVTEGDWSDILSRLVVTNSQLVVIKSDAAHIESDAVRVLSDTTAIHTLSTTIASDTAEIEPVVIDTFNRFAGIMPYDGIIGATGNDTTHVHLPGASNDDDELNGFLLLLYDVSGATYYRRIITDYVGATQLATVATLPITPQASTDGYSVISIGSVASDVWAYEMNGYTGATDAMADWINFTGYAALHVQDAMIAAQGTIGSTGNDSTHVHLDGLTFGDDELNGHLIVIRDSSAGELHTVTITDYVSATDLATVTPALPFTPEDAVDSYFLLNRLYNTSAGTALSSDQDSKLTRVANAIVEVDTSDIQSLLTKVYSDTTAIEGTVGGGEGDISDVLSRLTVTNSQLLVVKSDTSDIKSFLTVIDAKVSDIQSDTNNMVPIISDIQSDTSDIQSKLVALAAVASDIQSDTNVIRSEMVEADTSDILSMLTVVRDGVSDIQSDTNVLLTKVTEGDWSDILSRLVVTNSQLVVVKSDVAHIESDAVVIETVTSDIQSDTNVLITKVTEGDFSDILSRLVVTNSQLVVIKSDAAHIESDAVRVLSDTTAIHTLSTKIDSDQASQFVIIEENTSDTESALVKIYSDTTAIEGAGGLSVAQDSKLTAVHSDTTKIDTKTAGLTYTVANQVDVNIESVNGTQVDGAGTDLDPWGPV